MNQIKKLSEIADRGTMSRIRAAIWEELEKQGLEINGLYGIEEADVKYNLSSNPAEKESFEKLKGIAYGNQAQYIHIITEKGDAAIGVREYFPEALCFHAGKLYDASGPRILETLIHQPVAEREKHVSAICSHEGKLYDSAWNSVYETFTGNKIVEIETEIRIVNLCSHNGKLYHSVEKSIFETLTGKKVAERKYWVKHLCSHNGILLDIGGSVNEIFDTLNDKVFAKTYFTNPERLLSHKGNLYYALNGRVIDMDNNILGVAKGDATHFCSTNLEALQPYLQNLRRGDYNTEY